MKRLLFFLSLALVLFALPACDSNSVDPPDGMVTVTGVVQNTYDRALEGGTVSLGSACTTQTSATGAFSCSVPSGTYTVTIAVPGYVTASFSVTVSASGAITVPPIDGNGSIDAEVVNAVSGDVLANSDVECQRLMPNDAYSAVEIFGTTSATGQLVLDHAFLGEGQCQIEVGSTLIPIQLVITEATTGTIGATPPPASGTYRVVLSWGENPSDLDSHLTGPDGSGDRFHVYYADETFGETNLDLDDTSSYGPETITLVPSGDGMYRYSVHNYSEDGPDGAAGIYTSPTTVRLYDSTGLIRTYTAPAPTAQNGGTAANTWRVFEMTVTGTTVTFNGAAPAGLGYVTASSSGDSSTF